MLCGIPALATSTDGYHKIQIIPVAVKSTAFKTSFFFHNASGAAINLAITFYKGVDYAGGPPAQQAPVACPNQVVQSGRVLAVPDLPTLCPAVPAGGASLFGWLWVEEITPGTTIPFTAFTRVDNTARTSGFEIEGYPAHTFTGANAYVTGLRRSIGVGGTPIQTNCFVSALNEATTVTLTLLDGTSGATLGTPISVALPATQMARFLDIFGSTAGNYSNGVVRVTTTPTGFTYPGVIAFCTVQNNTTTDADFRIAKASPVFDNHVARLVVDDHDEENTPFKTGSVSTDDRNRHVVYFKHPDYIECLLGGGNEANLEILLVTPEGAVVARAAGNVGFSGYTGDKGQHGEPGILMGANGRWSVDVQALNPSGLNATYQIGCRAGSGLGGYEWVGRNRPHTP